MKHFYRIEAPCPGGCGSTKISQKGGYLRNGYSGDGCTSHENSFESCLKSFINVVRACPCTKEEGRWREFPDFVTTDQWFVENVRSWVLEKTYESRSYSGDGTETHWRRYYTHRNYGVSDSEGVEA